MLMPVPAEICKHPDFSLVFGAAHASEAEAPYCAVVANHEHKRLIQILHEDRVYEISSWDQVKPSIGDTEMSPLGAGAAEDNAGYSSKIISKVSKKTTLRVSKETQQVSTKKSNKQIH